MKIRGNARTIGAIIAIVTTMMVLIAAGAVTTVLLVKHNHHKNDIEAADTVAARFDKLADGWCKSTVGDLRKTIDDGASSDYASVSEKVDEHLANAPKLGSAPEYGTRHSSSYMRAYERADHLADGMDEVKTAAKAAEKKSVWVRGARKALSTSARDILPNTEVSDSGKIRSQVVPRYTRALQRFRKAPTPDGAGEAAKAVKDALTYAKNEFTALANGIDAGRNYEIYPQKKFETAGAKVSAFESTIGSDVAAAIKDLGPGQSGTSV